MKRSTSAGLAPAMSRMRCVAAPMPSSRSFGVLGTFVSARRPSRSSATMSVNVPPMSRPICTAECGLGDGAFARRAPRDASEHRGGVAVQDLLTGFLADLGLGERLPGPVAAELGAVGAADDAIRAVE